MVYLSARLKRGIAGVAAVLGVLLVLSSLTGPAANAVWIDFTPETPVAGVGGSAQPSMPGAFVPIAPTRFLDTRTSTAVGADSSVSFQVANVGGIPAGVSSVVFNLTVTGPQSFGYISAYASGTTRPNASNVNFAAGQTIPNLVTVPVGADGKVTLFNRSSGATQLIADVSGYYLPGVPSVPGAFSPLAPTRMLDTRNSAAVGSDSSVSFQVGGIGGIPAGVSAVVFNLTVTGPQSFGFITAYASGTTRPNSSNENFGAGQTVPNLVTVPVGADGKVTLFNRSSGTTDLIADVSGYYLSGTPSVPGAFSPLTPTRMLDTRTSGGVGTDSSVSFQVGGQSGIPSNAAAVVFNLTVTGPQSFGYVTAYASGTTRPNSSNENFSAGQTVPNLVTVPVGADGKVTLFNRSSGTTNLIADVAGYYLPSPGNSVATWGDNGVGVLGTGHAPYLSSPQPVTGLQTVKQWAMAGSSTIAALADGTVRAWGNSWMVNGTTTSSTAPTTVAGLSNVTSVASSGATFYAVLGDGTVRSWGYNGAGQLGNGTTGNGGGPVQVSGLTNVSQIITGNGSAYALLKDGTVRAWGSNYSGGLGNGTNQDSSTPVQVTGLANVTSIVTTAPSGSTVFAVRSDGSVSAWGDNSSGAFGNGTTTSSNVPVTIAGLTKVTSLTAGQSALYARTSDGTVYSWGQNYSGQLGDGSTTSRNVPALISGLSGVTKLAASVDSVLAVLADGTVRGWGENSSGVLGNGTQTNSSVPVQVTGLTGAKDISLSHDVAVAVLNDGTAAAWGDNEVGSLGNGSTTGSNTPVPVSTVTGIAAVAVKGWSALVLLTDGTVRAWGDNYYGQLGITGTISVSTVPASVPSLSGVASVTTSAQTRYAVMNDGTVKAWGNNSAGQFGNGNHENSITPASVNGLTGVRKIVSNGWAAYALLTDGTVKAWGDNHLAQLGNGGFTNSQLPVQVSGLSNVQSITTNGASVYALRNDGTAWAWGDNYYGQLGIGTSGSFATVPTQVSGLTGVRQVLAGTGYAFALLSDGTVRAWGNNTSGQLGTGTTTNTNVPVSVPGLAGVKELANAGNNQHSQGNNTFALLNDGTVRAWGSAGKLGNGTDTASNVPVIVSGLNTVTAISIGDSTALALLTDGTVRAWGSGTEGELGDGTYTYNSNVPVQVAGLTAVASITAMSSSNYAVEGDGSVWAWGHNQEGQLGNGSTTASNVPVKMSNLAGVTTLWK